MKHELALFGALSDEQPLLVDLRSDTVTRPTDGMRAAMCAAEVGDDVFGEDPTVACLEVRVAEMFGHVAGLFVPSGTMGNQIAMRLLAEPGTEVLTDADAHVVIYEMGASAAFFGVQTRTFASERGVPDPQRVLAMVRAPRPFAISTAAIALEQTHNVAGGAVIPVDVIEAISAGARERGVALHCDGARIWNAMVATGVSGDRYGRCFDTLSVCLSKGLGAPAGSVLVSSHDRIEQARWQRKRLGGGMRQVGVLAAAGLYALDHHLPELGTDHARAERLAAALGVPAPSTNIVAIPVADPPAVVAAAAQHRVLLSSVSATSVRLVVHRDLDDTAIDRAIEVLTGVLSAAVR
jgi:threonine aldolase